MKFILKPTILLDYTSSLKQKKIKSKFISKISHLFLTHKSGSVLKISQCIKFL